MNTSLKTSRRASRGFTLMEMILVLAIISLLVGLGIYSLQNVGLTAEMGAAKANVRTLETNLIRYKTMAGTLPSQSQGLEALVKRPGGSPAPKMWVQCMEGSALIDPWGEPYQYRYPGKRKQNGYDVYSKGPDKVDGTEDDIGNWE
jgi:general secretion pathway protein G